MVALVTLEQVKSSLRVDFIDSDTDLALKIEQATDAVVDYIKKPDHGWTVETVPGRVSAAIILVVKSLFDDSEKAELLSALAGGELKNPVVSLLYRLRDPALA